MGKHKKTLIYILLLAIVLLACVYTVWDLSRIFAHSAAPEPQTAFMQALRVTVVILCNLLISLIGKDGQGGHFAIKLSIAFIFILTADFLLSFSQFIGGMSVFGLVQIILSIRHLTGFKKAWNNGLKKYVPVLVVLALVLVSIQVAALVFIFYPHIAGQPLFYALIGYSALLTFSVFCAITSLMIGFFPKANSVLIAVGMICFCLCDATVGMSVALPKTDPLYFLTHFTWSFYTPALVFLTLSGYSLRYLAPWLKDE